ncbi:TonB-dependent receptor [Pseudidiomarina sp. 1APP75-32.1]|uniref:TonB-dependent receptor n=1 Tax=Pseudidiomarina terrestris TaxID=2820060 RepID=A0AAW7QYN2_9GAMM|nr:MULTISPECIES: TonB-dependent receptor [unclassified Pseudidiomarina]MDN7124978.1 TonB-dependent receptor [Pseudidiomarina sp. 1APP75-32.1]MDN7129547.1 TonB-dependent receptor [Pseudidiomarina sp. 1APR75-15]MDN7138198.1 TonB-dependent receptor [Pseudidiomarina sp. 1ASP75-14]
MKKLLFSSVALSVSAALFSSPAALAQSNESDAQADAERITVTGSRLKRAEAESAAPIQVFDAEDIEVSGMTSVEMILQRMSASAGAAGGQGNAYWTGNGYGTTQVNLRGLGINRTLVLLNGRRIVNGGTGANSSVDLNMIPVEMIQRIEVLKDGASAIYGADAVAGVVNIITRKSYDGFTVEARVGATDDGEGQDRNVNMIFGTSGDKGRIMATLGYRSSDEINMADQAGCALAEMTTGQLDCFGSSSTIGGRATILSGPNAGDRINFNQDPNGDGDSYEPYSSAKHNFAFFPYLNSVNPVTNWNMSVFGDYQLSADTTVFTEILYNNRTSEQLATPGTLRGIEFEADHPTNPTGETIRLDGRRLLEGGPRIFFQDVNTFRTVVGASGYVGEGWNWEVAYNYGRNTAIDGMTNIVNMQRLNQGLDPNTCGSNGIPCIDLLGYGDLSQEALDHIMFRTTDNGGNEQRSLTANITGDLFDLPAGWVPVAFGVEHRKERGWRNPDSSIVAGIMNTNQAEPIEGSYTVDEVYVETSLPLLADHDFAKSLSLDLAYRYSDYDTFGSDGNYKASLHWQVSDSLKLRATQSTAFRIPNIPELFGGVAEGNLTTTDPCDGWDQAGADPTVAANCQADGVPTGYTQFGATVLTTVGGNPNLKPEDAETFTAGVVWDVDFVENLQFTFDYYNIDIKNAIQTIPGSTKLSVCYNSENLSHPFCSAEHFTRDSLTGDINFLSAQPTNAATENVSGVDASVFYKTDLAGWASDFSWNVSYLDEYTFAPFEGASEIEYAGYITGGRGSYTHWRSNANATFVRDDWRVHYSIQYIGSADDINASPGDIGDHAPSVFYHNVQGTYFMDNNLSLTAGVNNLFDKEPPFIQSWTDANTDTMTYNLLGRQLYLKVRYSF